MLFNSFSTWITLQLSYLFCLTSTYKNAVQFELPQTVWESFVHYATLALSDQQQATSDCLPDSTSKQASLTICATMASQNTHTEAWWEEPQHATAASHRGKSEKGLQGMQLR